jgi:hypothetical protein
MKKLHLFWVSIVLFNLSMRSMENQKQLTLAEEYSDACLLAELLIESQSLKDSIKILMKLSVLCKDFNRVLTIEKIGSLCKKYSEDDRADMICGLFARNIRPCLYMPLSIAIHVGFGKEKDEINEYLLQKLVGRESIGRLASAFQC